MSKTLESLRHPRSPAAPGDTALSLLTHLDVRRFDMLVHAGPKDFRGLVQEIPNDNLDWGKTIFYTITDPTLTERLKHRFGKLPLWPDKVIQQACSTAQELPPQQYRVPARILEFIHTECDFKNEHADGHFLDHLDFCAEYCARYFTKGSPNVLFLHSICGVGTNIFPLPLAKIPNLGPLLTEHEFLHIQAFPGMLRLLFRDLMDTLFDENKSEPESITFHTFHGTRLKLEGDDLWMHLNYQLIHSIDFLPVQHFDQLATMDPAVRSFFRLHEYLRTRNKLWVTIRLDRLAKTPGMTAEGEDLPTWNYFMATVSNPETVKESHKRLGMQLEKYSEAIGHDLSFAIQWKP